MIRLSEITWLHWTGFLGAILLFLALDLGVFHRHARRVGFREALGWTTFWFLLAMIFAFGFVPNEPARGWISGPRAEFLTGYLLELSLSMDNVFVMAMIFSYFQVRRRYQHRILFWGILGALVMRGLMIGLGATLVAKVEWILYAFGGFLLVTGAKMLLFDDDTVRPERNLVLRFARSCLPVSPDFDGPHFTTRVDGRRMFTPMVLVLTVVETTDLVFAVDSIPAIFGVTRDTFVVFTSNVFAILGLRSLYFVLAEMIGAFRYLKYGLSVVLIYIGAKMLAGFWGVQIATNVSLGVVAGIIVLSIVLSLAVAQRGRKAANDNPDARD
jgi:tellurite resistance protein TerC